MWIERRMGTLIVLLLILQTVISGLIVWRLDALTRGVTGPSLHGSQLSAEVETIDLIGRPARGADQPVMTLVEFSDATCSACRRAKPVLDAFVDAHGDRVRHVVQTFPLRREGPSMAAALASRCAHRQGAFWALQGALLEGSVDLTVPDDLTQLAQGLGLDGSQFEACLGDPATRQEVDANVTLAHRLKVNGTPTFFVNGRRLRGVPRGDDLTRLLASLEATDSPAS